MTCRVSGRLIHDASSLVFLSLRNVEADVALRSTAAVFTYARSRGLFAGISLEGSYLIERKDTNRKYDHLRVCGACPCER